MTTPFAAYLDRLVADARASRDATVNTLDAINRRTSAANAEIRERGQRFLTAHDSARQPRDERDARFDPEDVWELPPREAAAPSARVEDDADAEDYPETWLR